MIKLHSKHSLVAAADGSLHSLDVEAVRRDLRRAFQACGVREDWSADHIALVLEEHAASRAQPGQPPLREPDLHAMICGLLAASGYEDVGEQYRALVPAAAAAAEPDPFRPWDHTRLEAELAAVIPLDAAERTAIMTEVAKALATLGLQRVRTELIRSLGRHVMQQHATEGAPPPPDSPWLVPPGDWPLEGLGAAAAHLVQAGALRLLPVSRFLPRIRVELDLLRLTTVTGTAPLTEIVYLPALAHCLDGVEEVLAQARRVLAPRLARPRPPAAHLVVCGLETLPQALVLRPSARAAKALRREVRALVEARAAASTTTAVLVTFR